MVDKKRYLSKILLSSWKLTGISELTENIYLIIVGLRNPIVRVDIVWAPPDCDKKSIKNPRMKLDKIKKVWS